MIEPIKIGNVCRRPRCGIDSAAATIRLDASAEQSQISSDIAVGSLCWRSIAPKIDRKVLLGQGGGYCMPAGHRSNNTLILFGNTCDKLYHRLNIKDLSMKLLHNF
jgi:hypothetical protein